MNVNIKTDILDYSILAEGFVMSGVVHNLNLDFLEVDSSEIPQDEFEEIEEQAKEALLDKFYRPELQF